MKPTFFKAILFVILGATSFGVLSSFVKLARNDGYDTAAINLAQVIMGFLILVVLNLFSRCKNKSNLPFTAREKVQVMLHGICVGLIGTFYILAIRYSSVATSIVLLSQSVWMDVLLESIRSRGFPPARKIIAVIIILGGTLLATNILLSGTALNMAGLVFGLLAAVASTTSIYLSSHLVVNKSPLRRTLYLVTGCLIAVLLVWGKALLHPFDLSILWRWGIVLALTGMVLPPLLYIRGMPIIGVGLSSIISSLQIPAAAICAFYVLKETVNACQWLGIALIIGAVVLMNTSLPQRKNSPV